MLPFTCAKSNPDDTGGQICQGLETCVKMRSYGSAQSYYDEKVRKIDLDATPCPYCGHRHCLSLYESYPRRCRDFADADNSGGYYAIRTGAGGTQNWTSFGRQNDAALVGKMIVSPEVIVEAAGPLGDAPSRPIKAFYNLCGYDPSEE